MASSSGSLETSVNSNSPFSFSNQLMSTSFTDLLNSSSDDTNTRGFSDRTGSGSGSGSGVPKFKSIPPPCLPISPPPISPSYFSIPPGFSLSELLDSPVLLSSSNILPSPTTGTIPAQALDWKTNFGNHQPNVKLEDRNHSDFTFHPQTRPPLTSSTNFQSSTATNLTEQASLGAAKQQHQQSAWNFQETSEQNGFSTRNNMLKSESSSMQSFSSEIAKVQNNTQSNNGFQPDFNNFHHQPSQTIREQRRSDDGYNWRKYGQKQVKGSENPRSYYKCTYPNCPTKKKVERSLDGQITEIVYKGSHNHPKPQSARRSSSNSSHVYNHPTSDIPDQSFASHGNSQLDSVATPENSSISIGDDDFDRTSQKSKSGGNDIDEDEPEAKRWKTDVENEIISAPGSRTVREPRVVVQTTSDIDILDDGYRWRKYGQKVVKGNPNPRSYYKCTNPGCPVRKHVERASHDLRAVITTYEGKHNHDVPAARGSGSHSLSRPPYPDNNNNNSSSSASVTIRPSVAMVHQNNNSAIHAPRNNGRLEAQSPYTLEMLQSPENFEYSFGRSISSNMIQPQHPDSNMFSRTKQEPRDDQFLESLLC